MSAKKLITLALAAALPLSVWAVPVETAATGKNQEAALKKAEVNAVRNVMLTITDEEFVRGHVSDIRQQIILNSGNLVTGSEILSSESNDSGQTTVRARFEVDRDKMAGIISKIGGGTAETPVTADTANTEPPKTDRRHRYSRSCQTRSNPGRSGSFSGPDSRRGSPDCRKMAGHQNRPRHS